jgi:hypothetical protein
MKLIIIIFTIINNLNKIKFQLKFQLKFLVIIMNHYDIINLNYFIGLKINSYHLLKPMNQIKFYS